MEELNGTEQFGNGSDQSPYYRPCIGSLPSKVIPLTTYSVMMLLSLLGNSFIVAVFYKNKILRTPVHYFIANMAISDLLIPAIDLPIAIGETYYDGLWLVGGVPGTLLCKLKWTASGISFIVSILSMVAIAVDRFHAIIFAMRPVFITRKICGRIIAGTWIISVALRAHYFYAMQLIHVDDSKVFCTFKWEPPSDLIKVFQITAIAFFYLLSASAIVLFVLYLSIIIFLYRQTSNVSIAPDIMKLRRRRNRRITWMLTIIVAAFFVAWIPYHVGIFLNFLSPEVKLSCFFLWFGENLPFLYTVINPIVYYIFNEKYRQGFRQLLCCPWPCGKANSDSGQSSASSSW